MVPRMQLLLVEDDPTMQTTLQRALTRRGMEVTAVGDGKAALSQWVGRVPDAVVLDLTLPGLGPARDYLPAVASQDISLFEPL